MVDPKGVYTLNKLHPDEIIYRNADGSLTRLTVDDFDSPEEFNKWKRLSDEDYHETEKADHIEANHTVSLYDDLPVISPESMLVAKCEREEREKLRQLLMEGLDDCLTPTQHRRLWLYIVDELTEEEIAKAENTRQQVVSRSILAAKKKLKNFLGEMGV